jgi:hypothetical protein
MPSIKSLSAGIRREKLHLYIANDQKVAALLRFFVGKRIDIESQYQLRLQYGQANRKRNAGFSVCYNSSQLRDWRGFFDRDSGHRGKDLPMTARTIKSLRALYYAAETRVPMRHDVARGMIALEKIAWPTRFRKDSKGRLIRNK